MKGGATQAPDRTGGIASSGYQACSRGTSTTRSYIGRRWCCQSQPSLNAWNHAVASPSPRNAGQ